MRKCQDGQRERSVVTRFEETHTELEKTWANRVCGRECPVRTGVRANVVCRSAGGYFPAVFLIEV